MKEEHKRNEEHKKMHKKRHERERALVMSRARRQA